MEQYGEREGLFTGELLDKKFLESAYTAISPQSHKKGWSPLLLVVGIATTLGLSLPVGFNIGVVNSPAEIIKQFCNESIYTRYDIILSEGQLRFLWSVIVSIFLVGGAIGSLTGSWFADNVGRRGATIAGAILNVAGGILFLISKCSNSVETLIVGRLLVGLAAGLITCTVPMYLTELAPLEQRGAMGVFCPLGITCGVLLAQILSLNSLMGTEELWPYLLSCYVVLVILFLILTPFLPESPKYLLFVKKNAEESFKQLARVRNLPQLELQGEIQDMQFSAKCAEEAREEKVGIYSVLTDRTLLLPILLVCSLQAGQQFSGINAVFYYSVSIFKEAGLSDMNSQLATIGAGCCNLFMACISIRIMSRCTRRSSLQFSCFSAAICLLVLTLSITYINAFSWMPYVCIVAVLSYVVFYGVGLGPIPYFIGSELFQVGPRPSAMALGSMANWGANFLIGLTFPIMQDSIGAGSFLIFATITLALFVFVRFYLPETKGRDTSEISLICQNGLRSRVLASPTNSITTVESMVSDEAKAV